MKKMLLVSDKYIKPSRDIAARMVGDEMVLMSVRDSQVYILNATASMIWDAADGQSPLLRKDCLR